MEKRKFGRTKISGRIELFVPKNDFEKSLLDYYSRCRERKFKTNRLELMDFIKSLEKIAEKYAENPTNEDIVSPKDYRKAVKPVLKALNGLLESLEEISSHVLEQLDFDLARTESLWEPRENTRLELIRVATEARDSLAGSLERETRGRKQIRNFDLMSFEVLNLMRVHLIKESKMNLDELVEIMNAKFNFKVSSRTIVDSAYKKFGLAIFDDEFPKDSANL